MFTHEAQEDAPIIRLKVIPEDGISPFSSFLLGDSEEVEGAYVVVRFLTFIKIMTCIWNSGGFTSLPTGSTYIQA